MRTTNLWKTLLLSAAMLATGVMTSCEEKAETEFDAELSTSIESATVTAGEEVTFTVTSNTTWTATIDDANNILNLSKTSGKSGTTSVTAKISESAPNRSTATVTFTAIGKFFGYEMPVKRDVVFSVGSPSTGTVDDPLMVADAIAIAKEAGSSDTNAAGPYYIKGIISKVAMTFAEGVSYGNANFYIKDNLDDSADFYAFQVYYLGNRKWVNGDTDVKVGDEVIIYGKIYNYSGNTPETTGKGSAFIYSLNGVTEGGVGETPEIPTDYTKATIAEFNAAPVSTTVVYELTGTVSNITSTVYGNFDLTDDTASVYVYGLSSNPQAVGDRTDQTFGSMGITAGAKIKIRGYRGDYQGKIEVLNAWLIEIIEKGSGSTDPDPTPGDDANVITKTADVKAGTYYLAGYSESYNTTTYAPYSYHLWTGTVSSNNGNSDLNTVNYQYNKDAKSLTLNPNLSAQDAAKGTAVKVEIVSAGSANTYYIKYNGKYLYSSQASTNRRMALGDSPAEWVFSDHAKGGLSITNNNVILGTGGATYDLLRSYAAPANSLVYGICLFTESVSIDGTSGGGGNTGGGNEGGGNEGGGNSGVDIINNAFTGIGTVTTYTDWSGKTGNSGAVYAGRSAGSQGSLQLRVSGGNEGVVTTASGGKVTKIKVKWNSQTTTSRTLDVYAKNSAYSTAADLFSSDSSTQGTKVASFPSTDGDKELTISGNYTFIGFRSNASALYLDEVQITWE